MSISPKKLSQRAGFCPVIAANCRSLSTNARSAAFALAGACKSTVLLGSALRPRRALVWLVAISTDAAASSAAIAVAEIRAVEEARDLPALITTRAIAAGIAIVCGLRPGRLGERQHGEDHERQIPENSKLASHSTPPLSCRKAPRAARRCKLIAKGSDASA